MSAPGASAGRRDLGLVVLWTSGALLSFSVSALSVRVLVRTLGIFESLTLRSLFGVAAVTAVALWGSRLRHLSLHRPTLQIARNVVHTFGQASWVYALTVLPLATVFALEFTMPAWLALMAVPFLGERPTLPRLGAVCLGLIGTLVILRPGLAAVGPGSLAALACAIAFAATAVASKRLTTTENTLALLFWMNVIQLPLNLLGSDPTFPARIEAGQIPAVLGFCISGLAAHFCLTQAYRHGDATVVVPIDFMRVPLAALIGWSLYGEGLDGFVIAGAAIVLAGIVWSLAAEARRERGPALDAPT